MKINYTLASLALSSVMFTSIASAQAPQPAAKGNVEKVAKQKAILGVATAPLSEVVAAQLNIKGVVIMGVAKNGAAAKAGLKRNDIIMGFAGKRITSEKELAKAVRSNKPGAKVVIVFFSGGKLQKKMVVLGPIPKIAPKPVKPVVKVPPFLGVMGKEITKPLAMHLKLKNGVLLYNVIKGSSAAKAGLKSYDIITAINGKPVKNQRELASAIGSMSAGNKVKISYISSGVSITKVIRLGARVQHKKVKKIVPATQKPVIPLNPATPYKPQAKPAKAKPMKPATAKPMKPAKVRAVEEMVVVGPEGRVYTFSDVRGKKSLTVVSKQGKKLWSGPISNDKEMAMVPAEYKQLLMMLKGIKAK